MGKNINVETKWKDYFVRNWMRETQVDKENNFSWVKPSQILVFLMIFFLFHERKDNFLLFEMKKREEIK